MNVIDKAINWAVSIANDNSHGYDQLHRWGPDYDCSSLLISAWQQAGVPVQANGATYTGNMKNVFVKCGFEAIKFNRSVSLKRGDVLLNEKHHTAMYIGDSKVVMASINENGKAVGGRTGDQTGREILTCNYYIPSYGWDYVLRYPTQEEVINVSVTLRQIKEGDICVEVGMVQTLLNKLGYVGKNGRALTVDNDFAPNGNTAYAVANFQKAKGLNPDKVIGPKTYEYLFKSNYI